MENLHLGVAVVLDPVSIQWLPGEAEETPPQSAWREFAQCKTWVGLHESCCAVLGKRQVWNFCVVKLQQKFCRCVGDKPATASDWVSSPGHGGVLPSLHYQVHGPGLCQETGWRAGSQKTKLLGDHKLHIIQLWLLINLIITFFKSDWWQHEINLKGKMNF